MKYSFFLFYIFLFLLIFSCKLAEDYIDNPLLPSIKINTGRKVVKPPSGYSFYTKYINAGGLVILSNNEVDDEYLLSAFDITLLLLQKRKDVLFEMARNNATAVFYPDSNEEKIPTDWPGLQEHMNFYGSAGFVRDPIINMAAAKDISSFRSVYIHELIHFLENIYLRQMDIKSIKIIENVYEKAVKENIFDADEFNSDPDDPKDSLTMLSEFFAMAGEYYVSDRNEYPTLFTFKNRSELQNALPELSKIYQKYLTDKIYDYSNHSIRQ